MQAVRQPKKQQGSSVPLTDVEIADEAFLELVGRGENEKAIAMLKKGQQINVADESGDTAVHKAARRGDKAFVLQLLKFGAVGDHADNDGVTPVMIAVSYGLTELVEELVSKGASLLAVTKDGATLLHTAVYSGHEETVRALLQIENIPQLLEIKDSQGRTPLQVASFRSSKDVCALLVSAGADFSSTDKRGNDCATLAQRVGRRNSKAFFDKLAIEQATKLLGDEAKLT